MRKIISTDRLKFIVKIFIVSIVLGLFIAACGLSGGGGSDSGGSCKSGYVPCSGIDKCCPSGYNSHCSNNTCAQYYCPSGTSVDAYCY